MKRYLVFVSDQYYPQCGMNDCIHTTDDFDEALSEFKDSIKLSRGDKHGHIYDCEEESIVFESYQIEEET